MKKNLLLLVPVVACMFFLASCSKNDDGINSSNSTPVGTWAGTGQYGTTAGNPTYPFRLTFKADGSLDVVGNNNTTADNANGTWQIVQDSVKATYTYITGTSSYTLSGKYTAGSNVMVGTIGLGTSTTGIGLFSVTKQ